MRAGENWFTTFPAAVISNYELIPHHENTISFEWPLISYNVSMGNDESHFFPDKKIIKS